MFDWTTYWHGFMAMLAFGTLGWVFSVLRQNVTHVDSMWSLFFLISTVVFCVSAPTTDRQVLLLVCVSIWALRLCVYLTWRNWGPHEDLRYVAIRNNNQPHFWLKSFYIVFLFQMVLAWIISLPLLGASLSSTDLNLLDYIGAAIWLFGFVWETAADWQLARFKAKPENKGQVLNTGVWHYSRHPNYFGESCLWWGYYLIALSAGAWWSLPAPLLMTFLLLKVSGVSLLENDIGERRPAYSAYIQSTNAFIPGKPKQ